MNSKVVLCLLLISSVALSDGQNRKMDSIINAIKKKKLGREKPKIDSLLRILKTEKDDTNKASTLDKLYKYSITSAKSKSTDSLIEVGSQLAEKLKSPRSSSIIYKDIGLIYLIRGNYSEEIKYHQKAAVLCEQIGDKKSLSVLYATIGTSFNTTGNYPEALRNQLLALKMKEAIGDTFGMGMSYVNIAMIYDQQNDDTNALKYDSLALKICKNRNDKTQIGLTNFFMSQIYGRMKNYSGAIKCLEAALIVQKQDTVNKGLAALTYINIGNDYAKLGNYREAMKNDSAALKTDDRTRSSFYHSMGAIYEAQDNYPMALMYFQDELELDKTKSSAIDLAIVNRSVGLVLSKQKKYDEAKKYLEDALSLAIKTGVKTTICDNYLDMAQVDSTMGDYKSALVNYQYYIIYRDSLKNADNAKKLVRAQMQFDFEKVQTQEKEEQDKKDARTALQSKKQKMTILIIAVFALSLAIIIIMVFRSLRITRKQKGIIERQKVIVEEQKQLVEEKNKEVLDSITYAKRLQDAILPPLSIIKKYLRESFVLYKPKDIVAGDFYWLEVAPLNPPEGGTKGNINTPPLEGHGEALILIAACDCTGHGVPGAMVSVVCSNALNRTVKEFKITKPGKILDKVRELVLETFEKSENEVKDGMDVSLCCINTKSGEVQWSGAYNPLWYIQKGELKEVAPDKQPIGMHDKQAPFNTHSLKLQKGDCLYLFTDGYADQFGGPKGKKFKYKQLQEKLLSIADMSMDKQKEKLDQIITEWKGSLEQVDDVLIIGIRV